MLLIFFNKHIVATWVEYEAGTVTLTVVLIDMANG